MRLLTREQAKKVDELAQSEFGITQDQLMENAGRAVVQSIGHLCYSNKVSAPRVLCVAGKGSNGADAWVVARQLMESDLDIEKVWVLTRYSIKECSQIWQRKREAALRANVQEVHWQDKEAIKALSSKEVDLLVDGIFGVGLDRPLDEADSGLIAWLNEFDIPVVAIDVPSGLNADTGEVFTVAIHATTTVTFGLGKPGLFLNRGPHASGKVVMDPIGLPSELLKRIGVTCFAISHTTAARWLPPRPQISHKGKFGKLVIFAGSQLFRGAAILCAKAALRSGVGYVYLISEGGAFPEQLQLPEVIYGDLERISWDQFGPDTTFVVGPGFVVGPQLVRVIEKLIERKYPRVILDAEALNELSRNVQFASQRPLPTDWLILPHSGEMSRLLRYSAEELTKDRLAAVRMASSKLGCWVLLKGFRTIVGNQDLQVIVLDGNVALAKAGSGDVLAGIIGSFRAQGLDPMRSALLGSSLHGAIADAWIRSGRDSASFIPQDIISALPKWLRLTRERKRK